MLPETPEDPYRTRQRSSEAAEPECGELINSLLLDGNTLCDSGNATSGISKLTQAMDLARGASPHLHFKSALAVFNREGDYISPSEALVELSQLRQIAITTGDAASLGALHVAVARTEGLRGHCTDAYRHLDIARRIFRSSCASVPTPWLDTIESSLELVAGNLLRARTLAESAFQSARSTNSVKYTATSGTNIALVALWTGNTQFARSLLQRVFSLSEGFINVRIGAVDNLAQLALFEDDLEHCGAEIQHCEAIISGLKAPGRSWYDLACQQTVCAYLERLGDLSGVVSLVDKLDGELARRQLRVIRTSLLAAKARALSRLGLPREADAVAASAIRICPRGAIDPLIVLEATKGLCLSLSGGLARGAAHFERALAACRAIGHRYHERWIERDRQALVRDQRETVRIHRHDLDLTDAALLLSDAATILGAGRSIDLLAHGAAEILRSVRHGAAVEVTHQSGRPHQPELTAATEAEADGTFTIRLRGSDRSVAIRIRHVQSLDEILLVRSVAELVRVAVSRNADSDSEDDEQNLWPRSVLPGGEDAIFRSPRMTELLKIAIRLADTDLPILLTGETGTGKEVFARIIHEHSQVKRGPFVPYNCSNMPRDLVESQLFGHRRGAFTGATVSFPGIIRAAERGTLFLDEVGDLDPAIQPKLLRFLEGAEIHPIGELRPQRVPVRIVAATNADLDERVDQQRFRSDLLYRLGVAKLALPPLRERKDEIPALASLFLERHSRGCHRTGLRLGDDLIAALLLYDWPGNIRQLGNEIRRVVAMAEDGQRLTVSVLDPEITRKWNARTPAPVEDSGPVVSVRLDQPLEQALQGLERHFIDRAMVASNGRVAEAAQLLGISRKGLFLKRRRRGLLEKQ